MTVIVALYMDRDGCETVRVFDLITKAWDWKNDIANDHWSPDFHGDKPESDIGDTYFALESEGQGEEFTILTLRVE